MVGIAVATIVLSIAVMKTEASAATKMSIRFGVPAAAASTFLCPTISVGTGPPDERIEKATHSADEPAFHADIFRRWFALGEGCVKVSPATSFMQVRRVRALGVTREARVRWKASAAKFRC
jgi:hypothetical protein